VRLSDIILKGTHPGTIPARFGLIWLSGFRGEDLNVKAYDGRTLSDGKSSPGLWPGELKRAITPRWAGCPLSFETGGTMGYNCCFFLNFVPLHIESPYNFGGKKPSAEGK
jgi:hypothetical protein